MAFNGTKSSERKCDNLMYHYRYNASPALCLSELSSYNQYKGKKDLAFPNNPFAVQNI